MTLISLLAHSDIFGELPPEKRLGTLAILIVGGTDTTRNSMSNMIRAFNMYPDEWEQLLADPDLLDTAVPEIIRWVTPIMYMRRTATHDFEFGGEQMREGDKVTIWYLSANQDEAVFEDAEKFIAGRANAGEHLSFGLGTHRCIGSRLAQLQLRILLEEMIKRQMRVEFVGPATQYGLPSVPGIEHMPVKITRGA
jgi:cytochrome P450